MPRLAGDDQSENPVMLYAQRMAFATRKGHVVVCSIMYNSLYITFVTMLLFWRGHLPRWPLMVMVLWLLLIAALV